MFIQHLLLVALWLFFSLFHSIFASTRLKENMQLLMKGNYKYYRVIYSVFSFIILGTTLTYHFTLKTIILWKVQLPEVIIAISGMIIGGVVMLFFTKRFFFELSGAHIFLKKKKQETLLKSSLYKYVRHPLYTATLLLVWSIFFYHPALNNLISCICITAYTIIGIHFEEKKLVKDFGESYIQYRSETPMLIPRFIKEV